MFLGTPKYSATVLSGLLKAADDSHTSEHPFEVCGVVSSAGRSDQVKRAWSSHVERVARDSGFTDDNILLTKTGREAWFLPRVQALAPDLCVTAGFGVMLTQQFLDVPPLGTVNLHGSLLPKYRGADPVTRCLQAGDRETGISLLYTVLRCDAGPIIQQDKVSLDPSISNYDLTHRLMQLGTSLLVRQLPELLSGRALAKAVPQDHQAATHAPKVSSAEEWLDVRQPAERAHNQVRALLYPNDNDGDTSGRKWHRIARTRLVTMYRAQAEAIVSGQAAGASSFADSQLSSGTSTLCQRRHIRIVRTRPLSAEEVASLPASSLPEHLRHVALVFLGDCVLVPCAAGTYLELLEISTSANVPVKDLRHAMRVGKHQVVLLDHSESTTDSP